MEKDQFNRNPKATVVAYSNREVWDTLGLLPQITNFNFYSNSGERVWDTTQVQPSQYLLQVWGNSQSVVYKSVTAPNVANFDNVPSGLLAANSTYEHGITMGNGTCQKTLYALGGSTSNLGYAANLSWYDGGGVGVSDIETLLMSWEFSNSITRIKNMISGEGSIGKFGKTQAPFGLTAPTSAYLASLKDAGTIKGATTADVRSYQVISRNFYDSLLADKKYTFNSIYTCNLPSGNAFTSGIYFSGRPFSDIGTSENSYLGVFLTNGSVNSNEFGPVLSEPILIEPLDTKYPTDAVISNITARNIDNQIWLTYKVKTDTNEMFCLIKSDDGINFTAPTYLPTLPAGLTVNTFCSNSIYNDDFLHPGWNCLSWSTTTGTALVNSIDTWWVPFKYNTEYYMVSPYALLQRRNLSGSTDLSDNIIELEISEDPDYSSRTLDFQIRNDSNSLQNNAYLTQNSMIKVQLGYSDSVYDKGYYYIDSIRQSQMDGSNDMTIKCRDGIKKLKNYMVENNYDKKGVFNYYDEFNRDETIGRPYINTTYWDKQGDMGWGDGSTSSVIELNITPDYQDQITFNRSIDNGSYEVKMRKQATTASVNLLFNYRSENNTYFMAWDNSQSVALWSVIDSVSSCINSFGLSNPTNFHTFKISKIGLSAAIEVDGILKVRPNTYGLQNAFYKNLGYGAFGIRAIHGQTNVDSVKVSSLERILTTETLARNVSKELNIVSDQYSISLQGNPTISYTTPII